MRYGQIVCVDETGKILTRMPRGLAVQPGVATMLAKRDGVTGIVAEVMLDTLGGGGFVWE